ncbi:unnamed protein product [Acanthoscelides obtectus]|uniref:Uncharacterized protein n=1 Tax=Acanthoscelides obtectus TaxID=200917 RepID=A0A9P0LGD1_ACAOB|nr:unnamed protein product [Acanthoscelides obtectus]CAK1621577.1 hypothetical protein AOBTE_LOCUS1025 [Acanthoscelides obtectus]
MCVLSLSQSVSSSNSSDYPELNPEWSYCFEFTWFGPDYSNISTYDGTCDDYVDEKRTKDVPCQSPIVISYDGTPPDLEYLWSHYKESILCKKNENQMCAKYTYFFNGKPNNVTYMCAKVQSMEGKHISDGCYKQTLSGGYKTEICVCNSTAGYADPPCNAGLSWYLNANTLHLTLAASLFLYLVKYELYNM